MTSEDCPFYCLPLYDVFCDRLRMYPQTEADRKALFASCDFRTSDGKIKATGDEQILVAYVKWGDVQDWFEESGGDKYMLFETSPTSHDLPDATWE